MHKGIVRILLDINAVLQEQNHGQSLRLFGKVLREVRTQHIADRLKIWDVL